MRKLTLNPSARTPKYKQIVQAIVHDIEKGVLAVNDQLPSISELSEDYYLARDTVEKAYRDLKARGYITSVQGKGFYVQRRDASKLRILLIMNKLSSYKKLIYYAFLDRLGDRATVDLQVHHYNAALFRDSIERHLGQYHYYVVMPHFVAETDRVNVRQVLERIPADELVLLDKDVPELRRPYLAVFQDFERDIYGALTEAADRLANYDRLVLVFPGDGNYPPEIVRGFRTYCVHAGKPYSIRDNTFGEEPQPGTAYVVLEETDLADLVKKIRQRSYTLGREVGLVSFNETTLKELLGITVITTDFDAMGRTAAALLLDKQKIKVKNPFSLIRRSSL